MSPSKQPATAPASLPLVATYALDMSWDATGTTDVRLCNGYVYRPPPATAWSSTRQHIPPERLQYEADYFETPTLCCQSLEFPTPQHIKQFSLPRMKERTHVSALSLDPIWVSPVDLMGVHIVAATPPSPTKSPEEAATAEAAKGARQEQ
ncbi:Aste57867_14553 [Aphanomyces stellatus]|uniref:Aste57867_14553 protein n=1 Tax=Aphanomyces stellatus TaxID=120398 RepID=A0A485L203_9STRA|nr:hypothetical protein As57867_014499 [Aphanomyces stellatus]VFT91373.1 Aste57867_14553 [Aphanomyces stellatus]